VNTQNSRKTFKIFIVLYIFGYVIFNWTDVSWIFNYKAVGGLTYDFFNPYSEKDVLANYYENQALPAPTIVEKVRIQENEVIEKSLLENVKFEISAKENILEIPKILVSTEIVFPQTKDINTLYKLLDSGVIYYPDSVLPTETGQITILGHSAPPGWPKIKHDTVFSNLDKLNIGDEIYLNINKRKYTYIIRDKKIIDKGQEIDNSLTNNTNVIVLVSCYPPGKDYKRIVVFGEILLNN
jgi:LPXTG-site transpeptidase (sortase) family protein